MLGTRSYEEAIDLYMRFSLLQKSTLKASFQPSRIPLAQLQILMIVQSTPGIRMGEVSKTMRISRPNLTPLVDQLVNAEYITRTMDFNDRRATRINLTRKGRNALRRERLAISESIEKFFSRLGTQEIDELLDSIENINNIVQRLEDESPAHEHPETLVN